MEKEDLVPTNPFAPRGQLGAELRRLRESAGLYLDEVANHLDCSVAKLSRLETGTGSPKLRDIRDLLDFYQVEDPKVRDRFFGWVEDGRDTKWVRSYGNWMTNFGKYLPLEAAATSIKLNQSWICPGLLQTPGYARAIIADCYPERSPDEITEFTRLRM